MARGIKKVNRKRAKRFEDEINKTVLGINEDLNLGLKDDALEYQSLKRQVGKMIKRLIDQKLIREQEFYLGDWVFVVKDKGIDPLEIIDINYQLRTARINDSSEGKIWIKFQDIVKDEDGFLA
ncbi:MAG: hypothetical protein COB02_03145 [Candidatus Cloacimonadota bacterium]|nr:MAG: hypothetical protein COB02_03145 [Candidatus Cloacimonadota bacterium]